MLKVTCLVRGRARWQWRATLVVERGGEEGGTKGGNKQLDTHGGEQETGELRKDTTL